MNKFSAQHYNAVAKELRWLAENPPEQMEYDEEEVGYQIGISSAGMRLARMFKLDNERFDPQKFFEQCQPDWRPKAERR